MAVLIGDKIRQNISDLMKDEIVLQMHTELVIAGVDVSQVDMSQANKEYYRRGGKKAQTIGSVYNALIKLSEEAVASVKGQLYQEGTRGR